MSRFTHSKQNIFYAHFLRFLILFFRTFNYATSRRYFLLFYFQKFRAKRFDWLHFSGLGLTDWLNKFDRILRLVRKHLTHLINSFFLKVFHNI